MVFIEDGTNVRNVLEIHLSGRNEGPTAVVVEKSFKLSSCDNNEERKKQVRDHLVANEEAIEIPENNDGRIERFGKDGRYPKREQRLPKEWWKNHILPQHGEQWTNVTLLDDPLNLCEALKSEDVSKWEAVMQKEYNSVMANGTWELTKLPKDHKSVGWKWVFCTNWVLHHLIQPYVTYKVSLPIVKLTHQSLPSKKPSSQ